jgi:hypothetical protein
MSVTRPGGFALNKIIFGFLAGALGVLVFHQLTLFGLLGRTPWSNWAPVQPFGVPAILNTTFWGGVWGIALAITIARLPALFPRRPPNGLLYLMGAFVFGAVLPTLVGWYVVPLIKGGTLGPRGIWYNALIINGMWGLGTAFFLNLLTVRSLALTSKSPAAPDA